MMKRYDKYKPSGVEWIGEIPEHWHLKKLKYLLTEKLKYGANESAELENEEDPRYIRITDFGDDGKLRSDTFKSLPFEIAKDYLLKEGDVLFARSGATVGKTFQFRNYKGVACFAEYLIKASPDVSQLHSDILYYFTKSRAYENWKNSIFNQATIQNIGADKYSLLEVPVPLPEEQTAIANYLDKKTAQIDDLIAKKQKLIEALKEERTAIINEAVSGEGKDWQTIKLKYLVSKVGSGITPTGGANVYQQDGIPLLRSQNIYSEGLVLNDVAFISEEVDEQMSNSRIKDGDVLLNITGASIGRCYYVPDNFGRGNVNQHVCIIRPIQSKIKTEYLHAFLISFQGQTLIDSCQNGANREGLNFQQIKSFQMPLPRIEEQEQVLHQLKTATQKINNIISKIENEIGLIQEYRTAMISEVVTGKIKVA